MFEIASEFESVAYRVIDELLRQHIKVHAYRSVSSDSIYIKLDAGVCGSVRVSDHRGKEKLKYKFNVDLSLSKQTRYVTHKMGYTRFYYSSDNLNLMFSDIAEVRANKMEQYGLEAKIKYPNDILINNKKISGILIESIGYKELEAVVVGIGVNVNVKDYSNVGWKATSMSKETNESYNINDILKKMIKHFNSLKEDDIVYQNYLNRSILLNKTIIHKGISYIVKSIEKSGDIILMSNQETITVPSDKLSISDFY